MKFCPNCGAKITDSIKFCTECGTKIITPKPVCEPPAVPVEVPPIQPAYEIPAPPVEEPTPQPTYSPFRDEEGAPKPKQNNKTKAPKEPREKKPANGMAILFTVIGVLALLVVGLLIVLLSGSGQDAKDELGLYEGVSCTMDGGTVSAKGEWIKLQKKGKATLSIMDSEFKAKWRLDGEKFTLEQSGDTYTGTLKDGILRIDLAGMDYLFAREGAITGPVTYKAVTGISHGQILDEELMDLIGGCYLVMNGDGTGSLYLFGEKLPITYTDTTVTMDGEAMEYTWKGDTMVLNFVDGSSFDLVATDENPADTVVSESDWETGEWEETDMETEILSYLQWPGQTFSTMDLSDATLSLQCAWGEATVWFKTGADGSSMVESMRFYVDTGSYDDLRQMLVDAYGDPTDEGEEPYVESNGGAVSYCWFDYPAGTLRLASASEYDFVEIQVNTN